MNWKANIPPFLPGTRIEAIVNHSNGTYKKGKRFVAKSVARCVCGCGNWMVDVGVRSHYEMMRCNASGKTYPNNNMYGCVNFRPVETQSFPLIKLSEIKEKETKEILIEN